MGDQRGDVERKPVMGVLGGQAAEEPLKGPFGPHPELCAALARQHDPLCPGQRSLANASAPQATCQFVPAAHETPPTATTDTSKTSKLVLEVPVQSWRFGKVIK